MDEYSLYRQMAEVCRLLKEGQQVPQSGFALLVKRDRLGACDWLRLIEKVACDLWIYYIIVHL